MRNIVISALFSGVLLAAAGCGDDGETSPPPETCEDDQNACTLTDEATCEHLPAPTGTGCEEEGVCSVGHCLHGSEIASVYFHSAGPTGGNWPTAAPADIVSQADGTAHVLFIVHGHDNVSQTPQHVDQDQLARIDASGTVLSSVPAGAKDLEYTARYLPHAIGLDPSGSTMIVRTIPFGDDCPAEAPVFGLGGDGHYITRIGADGSVIEERCLAFGGGNGAAAITGDGGVLIGAEANDGLGALHGWNADGTHAWGKDLPYSPLSIAARPDGGVVVAGLTTNYPMPKDVGIYLLDAAVNQVDALGTVMSVPADSYPNSPPLAVGGDGSIVVALLTEVIVFDPDGARRWSQPRLEVRAVAFDPFGNVLLLQHPSITDTTLIKLDPTGADLYQRTWSEPTNLVRVDFGLGVDDAGVWVATGWLTHEEPSGHGRLVRLTH